MNRIGVASFLVLAGCPSPAVPDGTNENLPSSIPPTGPGHDIRLAAVDPTAPIERLTSDPADETFPSPKRDGSMVVFQVETYEGEGAARAVKTRTLFAYEPAAKKRVLFTPEDRASLQPSFFPDDKRFAYVTNALGPLAIVIAEDAVPNASFALVIGSDLAPELAEPSIAPDGSKIAFSMKDKAGGRTIAIIGSDGSKLSPIGEGRAPAWSPKGDKLAFVRSVDGYNHLFVVESATGEVKPITTGELDCDRPSFSPDGNRIVFATNHGFQDQKRSRSEHLHLFVVGTDGKGLAPLTRGTARAATPAWGTDGWIYFSSDRERGFDIFRVRAPG